MRVIWAIFGQPPYYAEDLSLLALGIAKEGRSATGLFFAATEHASHAVAEARERGVEW